MSHEQKAPTSRQLAYLKTLANQRGVTFICPRTRRQASAEINRLRKSNPVTRVERQRETKQVIRDLHDRAEDATRIQADEVTGYGASATWAKRGEGSR
jgi:hypothetical protein